MAISAFGDKGFMPDDNMVATALGDSFTFWETIKKHLQDYKNINEEWKFYGKEAGWSKNIKSGKRTLFMFVPTDGAFRICFTFSEKACEAAKASDLPKEVVALIPDTKQCVCGFGFMFNIKTEADTNAAIKLIAIKDKS